MPEGTQGLARNKARRHNYTSPNIYLDYITHLQLTNAYLLFLEELLIGALLLFLTSLSLKSNFLGFGFAYTSSVFFIPSITILISSSACLMASGQVLGLDGSNGTLLDILLFTSWTNTVCFGTFTVVGAGMLSTTTLQVARHELIVLRYSERMNLWSVYSHTDVYRFR